jgi:branched-chain amino acid transport system substrate-binding protein
MKPLAGAVALLSACSLALAACSTSADVNKTDSSSGGASGGPVSKSTIDAALHYTGGAAGAADPSKAPLVIGYTNQEGGVPSFPGQTKAVDAAVRLVNEQLGGVDGHPLKLDKCLIQAEEDGQKCASQFLADKDIKVVNLSSAVVGNAPFYRLIAGNLPVVVSVPGAAADYTTKGVYELDGGGDLTMKASSLDIQQFGAKDVAIVSSDNPAGKFIVSQVLAPAVEQLGIKTKIVYVSDSGTTPDYVSALQSVGAADAGAIYLGPATPAGCVAAYQAMQQLGIKDKHVSSTHACQGDPIPESLNGGPAGFWIRTLADSPLVDTPETNAFRDAMTSYGAKDSINAGNTQKAFSDILTITKLATTIGFDKLTPQAFTEQISSFAGPAFMVPGKLACGANKAYVGICGTATPGSTFQDGKWQALPARSFPE